MAKQQDIKTEEGYSLNEVEMYAVRRMGQMRRIYLETPTYIVDRETMDSIIPEGKLSLLEEKCLAEKIKTKQDGIDFWELAEECLEPHKKDYIAAGFYFNSENAKEISKAAGHAHQAFGMSGGASSGNGAIVICPQMVNDISKKVGRDTTTPEKKFKVVFSHVLFRNLGFALMDGVESHSKCIKETWGRVIEESLASAIAYSMFRGNIDKSIVKDLIENQPLEYRGDTYLMKVGDRIAEGIDMLRLTSGSIDGVFFLAKQWKHHRLPASLLDAGFIKSLPVGKRRRLTGPNWYWRNLAERVVRQLLKESGAFD